MLLDHREFAQSTNTQNYTLHSVAPGGMTFSNITLHPSIHRLINQLIGARMLKHMHIQHKNLVNWRPPFSIIGIKIIHKTEQMLKKTWQCLTHNHRVFDHACVSTANINGLILYRFTVTVTHQDLSSHSLPYTFEMTHWLHRFIWISLVKFTITCLSTEYHNLL